MNNNIINDYEKKLFSIENEFNIINKRLDKIEIGINECQQLIKNKIANGNSHFINNPYIPNQTIPIIENLKEPNYNSSHGYISKRSKINLK